MEAVPARVRQDEIQGCHERTRETESEAGAAGRKTTAIGGHPQKLQKIRKRGHHRQEATRQPERDSMREDAEKVDTRHREGRRRKTTSDLVQKA